MYYTYGDSLYHHGILGQRWGVRRFQNEDGGLTSAGKKRYNENIEKASNEYTNAKKEYKIAKQKYNKKTAYGILYDANATEKLMDAQKNMKYAKDDLADEKIKSKIQQNPNKSKRQLAFEETYKSKGMTSEEAEVAAYKRIQTEKIIAITAGVAVTAAVAYVGYKHIDKNIDKIIKPGTLLQNISTNGNKGVEDAFYASMNRSDNTKYRGMLGETLQTRQTMFGTTRDKTINVYETRIGVNSGLKVASTKSATTALRDIVNNNPQYQNTLKAQINDFAKIPDLTDEQVTILKKATKALNSGKVNTNVYDATNLILTNHSEKGQEISKGLYDKLKSYGYDAIIDSNDKKYSGYNTKAPVIVFNGLAKTSVNNIRNVGADEIDKACEKANGMLYRDYAVKSIAVNGAEFASAYLGISAASTYYKNKSNDKIVSQYRKDHPNTELSYKEIVRNYKKG